VQGYTFARGEVHGGCLLLESEGGLGARVTKIGKILDGGEEGGDDAAGWGRPHGCRLGATAVLQVGGDGGAAG
jgi:hypothetical protein